MSDYVLGNYQPMWIKMQEAKKIFHFKTNEENR